MSGCKHGFVVRDIEGDNRFLCRECDVRFPHYPRKIDWKKAFEKSVNWDIIKDALKTFEPGFVERMNK